MHRSILKSLLIILLILVVCLPAFAGQFTGKVVGVLDGDTIEVLVDKKPIRVRLHGIDCPEKGQPRGNRAKWYASDLAFKKTVTVIIKDIDRYGRTVGEVILPDGKSLNKEIVRAGYAWWYRKYVPDDKELAALPLG
jgi:endonuclease YncB( thermonuclease family)